MNTIAVYEDGELISDPSRMELLGNVFDANPYTLTGDLKVAIDGILLLRVHSEAAAKTYRIKITDESGESSSVDIDILAGTILTELQGVLFNVGGGQGTGGLDLDEGNSTNSDDSTAEIRDLGIDIDLPADQNWLQRIAGVNGFTIKYLFPGMNGLPEGFTFEGISFQEQIPSLWDLGTNFGVEENGEPVS